MHLARHTLSSTLPPQILDTRFDADAQIFTASTPAGFAVYNSWPLKLLRKRELTGGTLSAVIPMHTSSLLFLLGGGRSPLYPPNKVVLWDDALGREVSELEFKERVRGIACRRDWLVVSLKRRVVAFRIGQQVTRFREWDTCDNERGLVAIATATHSTLLVIPGRQTGHVQLIHLTPCRPPTPLPPPAQNTFSSTPLVRPSKHPISIIAAHTTALTALSVVPSGRLLATTSSRGTLLRIWDAYTGKLVREFRRGTDKAEIYGIAFRPDEQEVCVWSDKGTVHVFSLSTEYGSMNRHSSLSPLSPFITLPKYFESEWSYARYRIPTQTSHLSLSASSKVSDLAQDEKCVVAWIQVPLNEMASDVAQNSTHEYQLVVLTLSGCWYRLSLPHPTASRGDKKARRFSSDKTPQPPVIHHSRSVSGSSVTGLSRKQEKGKEREEDIKSNNECTLQEFRRFGRWDGWG